MICFGKVIIRRVALMWIIIYLIILTVLFLLWQYSRGEKLGSRLGLLVGIWGVVIAFYLLMVNLF